MTKETNKIPLFQLSRNIQNDLSRLQNKDDTTAYELLLNKDEEHNFLSLMDKFRTDKGLVKVLDDSATIIAENLALHAPKELHNVICRNIQRIFPRSKLSQEIQVNFSIQQQISILLGEKPEEFFNSRDFNIEHCKRYPALYEQLKGHEERIGKSLSTTTEVKAIQKHLELINSSNHQTAGPFWKIYNAMLPNPPVLSLNPVSMFGRMPDRSSKISSPTSPFAMPGQ